MGFVTGLAAVALGALASLVWILGSRLGDRLVSAGMWLAAAAVVVFLAFLAHDATPVGSAPPPSYPDRVVVAPEADGSVPIPPGYSFERFTLDGRAVFVR